MIRQDGGIVRHPAGHTFHDMIREMTVLGVLMVCASPVFAGLSITPSRAEIVIASGQEFTNTYVVGNDFGVPIDVDVATKDWFVLPENKNITVGDWLRVATTTFHLAPGATKDVGYTVTVPTQAVGSLVAMISFTPRTDQEQGVTLVVSVPVFVTVAGTEKIAWDFSDLAFTNAQGKLQVSAKVTNQGNVHVRPSATVVLTPKKGLPVFIEFKEGRPVYPGSYRTIVGVSDTDLCSSAGAYKVEVKVRGAGQEKMIVKKLKINRKGELKVQ